MSGQVIEFLTAEPLASALMPAKFEMYVRWIVADVG